MACAAVFLHAYVEVRSRFEGRLWKLPSRVYSAAPVLRAGEAVSREAVTRQLERLGFAEVDPPVRPGQYRRRGTALEVHLRAFDGAGQRFEARRIGIEFRDGRIAALRDTRGSWLDRVVLEPELLATLHGSQQEDRDVVRLSQVPKTLIQAVLAAEDARFRSHHGVDPKAIVRAALANLRSGRIVQGGSTITQQTVKNLYLGQQRTWWRKIREVLMAAILDGCYDKDRILEVYLNEVYLGQRGSVAECGVQAAARWYFGRDLADLSLAEHALLAGLIRSPGLYNPFVHPERALARRDDVLAAMEHLGFASEAAVRRARSESLHLSPGTTQPLSRAPYVIDYVRSRLDETVPPRMLTERGLRVFTSVDPFLQEAARDALSHGLERLERDYPAIRRRRRSDPLQGLVIVTRPSSGEILAMVGGRDYRASQFNRAAQASRQPGSCFKPFVYLAGFDAAIRGRGAGLVPASILDDEPLELRSGGEVWRPVNYDNRFRGPVSARFALEKSLNVPTVRAAERIGLAEVARVAEACGLDRDFRLLPSLALGAQEITPVELATAFGTIANLGRRVPAEIVQAITDLDGKTMPRPRPEVTRAVSPQAAFLVNDILQGVLLRGTGASAADLGFRGIAAGKTGTTDDTRDAWFVGYTPGVLALVWVGYDDNARTGLTGASGALPIWVDFMRRAGLADSLTRFPEPPGIVRATIDPESGQLAVRGCPDREVEVFAAGTEPRERCPLHRPGLFRRLLDRFRGRPTV